MAEPKVPANRAADRLKDQFPEVPTWMVDAVIAIARSQMRDAVLRKINDAATFPSEVQAAKWITSLIANLE